MSLFSKLLVPLDGSEHSDKAVDLGVRLASNEHAAIVFVNVVEVDKVVASIIPGQGMADPGPAIAAMHAAGTQMLKDALGKASAAKVEAASELCDGDCVETILAMADKHKADLIVMGSHGRTGFRRLVLGSVAEGVLRQAHVPVLITKAHA